MAVLSDGNPYQHLGIPEGLIFSFPVICSQGTWQIVEVYYDYTITASAAKRAAKRCALFETVPYNTSMLLVIAHTPLHSTTVSYYISLVTRMQHQSSPKLMLHGHMITLCAQLFGLQLTQHLYYVHVCVFVCVVH
jgi:hypothetical protein